MMPSTTLLVLVLAGSTFASDRSDLVDNFAALASAHADGATLERDTVHRSADGFWRALARAKQPSKKIAIVTVDFGTDDWTIKTVEWISSQKAARLRDEYGRAANEQIDWKPAGSATADPPNEKPAQVFGRLPEMSLYSADGEVVDLRPCRTDKCLTIVVAPWCRYCRAAIPAILRLRDYARLKRVTVRVIVTKDSEERVREYAKIYGGETLLDPTGEIGAGGIPKFWVTETGGDIIGQVSGMNPDEAPAPFAKRLGLP